MTLHKIAGWSLILFATAWIAGSAIRGFSPVRINVDLIGIVTGIVLMVAGFRIKRGQTELASTGVGCMWFVLVAYIVTTVFMVLIYLDLNEGWGVRLGVGWRGGEVEADEAPATMAISLFFVAWAIANLVMLKKWVREVKESKAEQVNED